MRHSQVFLVPYLQDTPYQPHGHPSATIRRPRVERGAGSLAAAPNVRLEIDYPLTFATGNLGSKSCKSNYIELIRMPVSVWPPNCHNFSRPAGWKSVGRS